MNTLCKILLAIPVLQAICHGQECDLNGISCINCTDYQKCSGGAPSGPVFSCKNGARCVEKPLLEHCWMKLNCFALNECSQTGIFPDVMVESNYFVCLPDSGSGFIKYDFTCPEGEYFDANEQMCLPKAVTSETTLSSTSETTTAAQTTETTPQTSATSTSASTPSPTPETTTAVQTTETTPQTSATSTSASTPSPTPETTTAVPTTAPTSSPSPFTCTAPGIFPNPTNCKMYFRCSTSLKVFNYICPGTSYFNENILKCSLIITSACEQQILQSTTTSTMSMTTTSTTTTTPVPTIPSTTTATAVPTSSTITTTPSPTQAPTSSTTTQIPFACSAAGTFENPLDCKTYYRCSSSGKTFLYVCPNGSYYNEFTKRCGLTITPRCRSKLSQ